MTGTFIGEHSPMPSTPASVDTRTSAVRVFKGYARTSVIFAVIVMPPRMRVVRRLPGPMLPRMRAE